MRGKIFDKQIFKTKGSKSGEYNFKITKETDENYVLTEVFMLYSFSGNCQMFSIIYFNMILYFENVLDILLVIKKYADKKLMIIDVNKCHCETIDKLFEGYITLKSPYESSNRSNMCIYIIQIEKCLSVYEYKLASVKEEIKPVLTTLSEEDSLPF